MFDRKDMHIGSAPERVYRSTAPTVNAPSIVEQIISHPTEILACASIIFGIFLWATNK